MSVDRRSFLIGAGSLITASFVRDVTAFVADTKSPLLVVPEVAAKTIYYEQVEDHWRLHLGQPQFEIPEPQLLIENLRWHGHQLDTQQQIDAICDTEGWTEEELFQPLDGYEWETQWEHNLNPEALAFQYLSDHGIFPAQVAIIIASTPDRALPADRGGGSANDGDQGIDVARC